MNEKKLEINLTGESAAATIALLIVLLVVVFVFAYGAVKPKRELVILEIEKTQLEIEKLKYELAIYREQEALVANAE